MRNIFHVGDKKTFNKIVKEEDIAEFESGVVHKVCSTFALGRDVEWSSRLFVLEMKEDDEEGIGTLLEIEHRSPAFVGEEVCIVAEIESLDKNEIICTIEVTAKNRLVAVGRTGQKVLKKEKLKAIFDKLANQ